MRKTTVAGLAVVVALAVSWQRPGPPVPQGFPLPLPPVAAGAPLPPLPERSPRNANYTITARLDPAAHTIDGSLVLEWRNLSDVALDDFPFHLYWNAFRNNLSTSARGDYRRAARTGRGAHKDRGFGYTHVKAVKVLGEAGADITSTLRYLHPDDDNSDDRTLMEVRTPFKVAPGASVRFAIEWTSRIPYGDVGRSGWIHDYNFIVQWFPKIAVHWKGAWNAHQFHPSTEFFADYGSYDVTLTLPAGFVVGATGVQQGDATLNADGTQSLRFVQQDVHDFAWCASRRFLVRTARFDDAGYPPVEIRLLLQPEHAHQERRYLEATRIALRSYGTWGAPYPYGHITVVDPAWRSASGGMEYPTLFTGGSNIWTPAQVHTPEGVTIHEAGHQFWYGLVGNNEFEEAWLDEGVNTYHTSKAEYAALGPEAWSRRYFGLAVPGRGSRGGIALVAPGVWIGRGEDDVADLRRGGTIDEMVRRAWEYRTGEAYGLNSYGKPALTLHTLENLLGDETMTRVMRTYARRYRFGHPTSRDFIDTVNEVTGKDYTWYFERTWYSSDLCDYAVEVKNKPARTLEGFSDSPGAAPVLASPTPEPTEEAARDAGPWESEVIVKRLGAVRMPVEVLVEFADGERKTLEWDGAYRWKSFRFSGRHKVTLAYVDPERKLMIDVRPGNNGWVDESGTSRRAARKWAGRFLFWLQNLLELHLLLA